MLTISFVTHSGAFTLADVPEQWQPYVSLRPGGAYNRTRVSIDVQPEDSSYRYRALMQPRQLVLKFSLPFFIEFPVGSSCVFEGETYYVRTPEDIKKQGERNIEYSMTLGADDSNLADYKFRNSVDGRLKWSMCAKPHEFIEELVKNLNARDGADVWHVGTCIESTEKTVEFNHTYCDAALNDIASAFETEWEIDAVNHIVHLRKVEYNKDDAEKLSLSYGRGNGFVPGVGRASESDGKPLKRLYVQGGERNIDRSKYGKTFGLSNNPGELRLPKNQVIEHDGRKYVTDGEGYYIERAPGDESNENHNAVREDSLDCSEIYPSRVGTVSEWRDEDVDATLSFDKNLYDFVDSSIPANLDFNSYQIAGESMTVIFQTGMLAGNDREFEVKYIHDVKSGKPGRRFEIVPQEIDGVMMPNETFKAQPGDEYAVFGIMLPNEYVCDDVNQKGASWDMFREGARYMREHEDQKFTFSGELQSMWAKRNWANVGARLRVGGYVLFTDNQFAVNGVDIRIVGIKDYLTNPYAPTVELSNSISSPGTASSAIQNIDNAEVIIDETRKSLLNFTKRRFRDAKETMSMLADAQLENFNGTISPAAIQTMGILLGDESLQFLMGKTLSGIGSDDWSISFADGVLSAPSGYLRHMTIGVNTITANREAIDFLTWQMPSMQLTPKTGSKYYVYAVVNRSGFTKNADNTAYINSTPGTWEMYEIARRIDYDPNKFYLLVGILNSEYMGERSFATLYGFTEILPGRMTTDIIVSNDGKTYMNLKTGEICGNIKFLSDDPENPYITIIEGGKIKTELLDVSDIIARAVIVGEPGKNRVEIQPNNEGNGSVKIFDADDNEVTVFEGNNYKSIADLYDDSTGGDCTMLARTKTEYGYASGVTLGRGKIDLIAGSTTLQGDNDYINDTVIITDKWHTSAPTEIKIKQGHIIATAQSASYQYQVNTNGYNNSYEKLEQHYGSTYASAFVRIQIVTFSDEECKNRVATTQLISGSAYAGEYMREDDRNMNGNYNDGWNPGYNNYSTYNVYVYGETKSSGLINLANKRVKVPAGWHRIEITMQLSAYRNGSSATINWGFTATNRDDIMAEYKNDSYVSRFFANGFCLGTRSDNYVMAYRTDDGMEFIMENNDMGFHFSKTGVRTRSKGKNWMPLPMLIYKASYKFNSSNSTYDINTTHGYKSFNGTTMNITRTSKGLVTLTFPADWVSDLGSINIQNLLVQVNSYHNVIDARVRNITSTSIQIGMSDDASLNDGDFGIVLYYLPS